MKQCMVVLGVLLIGFSVTLLNLTGFGVDPFNCMNMAVSGHLPVSYGIWQLFVNCVLFAGMVLYRKIRNRTGHKLFGFGTVVNMVFVGILVDWFTAAYHWLGGEELLFVQRCLLLIPAIAGLCLGCSLYMTANLGSAPYDSLGQEIARETNTPFRGCRIASDLTCVIIAVIFGGKVGVGSVISACGTGPFIQFFNTHVSRPLLSVICGRKKKGCKKVIAEINQGLKKESC